MNELNFASLRASKKLVDNSIVLETDTVWYLLKDGDWYLSGDNMPMSQIIKELPAPSFVEIWRELPDEIELEDDGGSIALSVFKSGKTTYAGYYLNKDEEVYEEKESSNPADALAELLIWVKGQEEV
jgi:hypothetical protein